MNSFDKSINTPKLTEIGVTSFINESLRICHANRMHYYNIVYNISLFILFIIIFGGIIFLNYKGKLSKEEIEQRENEKKTYILSKIKNYQNDKIKMHQNLITELPHF